MAENPLLPHRKLKELHALILRARALNKAPAGSPHFEALLAATLMHVEVGDFVSPPPGAPAAAVLAAEHTTARTRKKSSATPVDATLPAHQRLAAAAGIAQGLRLADGKRVAVFYTDGGAASARSEEGWAEALAYAQRAVLPLLVVCADSTGGAPVANPNALSWASISKLARQTELPVFPVDGEDAVAVYRVMQESALRARTGGGPAVLWAVLSRGGTKLPRTQLPLARLESYLAARGIVVKR